MTIEDINYQLSNLREDVEYLLGRTEQSDIYLKALDMAMSALRVQQEAEKNEPLKLEQLLEMDGQPVWVEHPSGYKHYNGWCGWNTPAGTSTITAGHLSLYPGKYRSKYE